MKICSKCTFFSSGRWVHLQKSLLVNGMNKNYWNSLKNYVLKKNAQSDIHGFIIKEEIFCLLYGKNRVLTKNCHFLKYSEDQMLLSNSNLSSTSKVFLWCNLCTCISMSGYTIPLLHTHFIPILCYNVGFILFINLEWIIFINLFIVIGTFRRLNSVILFAIKYYSCFTFNIYTIILDKK